MTLRDDINAVIKDHPEIDFKFVRLHEYEEILDRIAERFLKQGRKSLRNTWLWEAFDNAPDATQPSDVIAVLEQKLSSTERYWFLAVDHGKEWVADASGSGIISTLKELYFFEYYIVDRKMNWLLCENHHGMLIEAAPAVRS